jgi:hypothetical protein
MFYTKRFPPTFVACLIMLAATLGCNPAPVISEPSPPVATPTVVSLVAPPALPTAEQTVEPPIPGITPTQPIPTITPTPAVLQAATLINPTIVTTISWGLDVTLTVEGAINTSEPIASLAWAPEGDKLVFITRSGKLYWSNADGSSQTLLHAYEVGEDNVPWDIFRGQNPRGNTLLVQAWTGEILLPSHTDVIRFTPGAPPIFTEKPELPMLFAIDWWRQDRASAILGLHDLDNAYYIGGERLVIVDADGRIIEERNIPYMDSASIRPGGEWLAYTTGQQTTLIEFQNAEPQTTYLLNLVTGQRLQISPADVSGRGRWSPDGSWFTMGTFGSDICGPRLVSADAHEHIVMDQFCGNALWDEDWSADSRRFIFSQRSGGCDDPRPDPCPPYTSKVYMVDVPARKMVDITGQLANQTSSMAMQPRWSPDGSKIALLTYDPACVGDCSGTTPAVLLVSVK